MNPAAISPELEREAYAVLLRRWATQASVKDLLAVLADKRFTEDDLRASYFESCVDLEQNGMEAVSGFKGWLQWKFNCAVAVRDLLELQALCCKVKNKTKGFA